MCTDFAIRATKYRKYAVRTSYSTQLFIADKKCAPHRLILTINAHKSLSPDDKCAQSLIPDKKVHAFTYSWQVVVLFIPDKKCASNIYFRQEMRRTAHSWQEMRSTAHFWQEMRQQHFFLTINAKMRHKNHKNFVLSLQTSQHKFRYMKKCNYLTYMATRNKTI